MVRAGGTRGVVQVGRKAYAVGLMWRVIDDPDQNPRMIAATEAKEVGGDLFVANRTDTLLLGIGDTRLGHKPGMPVLALALLENFAGSTLAAFLCDGGVYVVAFRDDQIVSGIENWFADAEEARSLVADLLDRTSWNKVFAPREWSIPDADQRTIDDLLADVLSEGRLRPIARTREIMVAALAFLVLLGGGAAWWHMEQERIQEFMLAQQMALSAERAAREAAIRAAREQEFPAPSWAGKMPASVMIRACRDAVLAAPVTVPGWNALRAECQGNRLTIHYRRDGGTAQTFARLLATLPEPPELVHRGNEARISWRVIPDGHPARYSPSQATQAVSFARSILIPRLEAMGVFDYTEQVERGAPSRILSAEGHHAEVPLEQSLRLVVNFPSDNLDGISTLSDGLVATLRVLSLDFGNFSWRLEMDAHERLAVPGLSVPGVPRQVPGSPAFPRRTS